MHYIKKEFVRFLRKDSTKAEEKVWNFLRNRKFNSLKFRRQHELNGFIVDFYSHELRLAIEIDGEIHNKQMDYDRLRQELIEKDRVTFIRVTNEEVMTDINKLFDKIVVIQNNLTP